MIIQPSHEAAFIELNAPPKRGRPFKNKPKPTVAELLRAEAEIEEETEVLQ